MSALHVHDIAEAIASPRRRAVADGGVWSLATITAAIAPGSAVSTGAPTARTSADELAADACSSCATGGVYRCVPEADSLDDAIAC